MKKEEYKEKYEISENSIEWKNISTDSDFDSNIFGFIMEEKFKLLNYTYEYIDKVYEDIANFPRKHELIKNKLIDSGVLEKNDDFNIDVLKDLLNKKFSEINYEDAKKDVLPFINDTQILKLWNEDFFKEITNNLK